MSWTPEKDDFLAACIADGQTAQGTAGLVSAKFGEVITRNACIGRAARRQLGAFGGNAPAGPRKARQARPCRTAVNLHAILDNAKAIRRVIPTAGAVPGSSPVHLMDLDTGHCRWPIGEGAAVLFCAEVQDGDRPYCPAHSRVAYRAATITPRDLERMARRFR